MPPQLSDSNTNPGGKKHKHQQSRASRAKVNQTARLKSMAALLHVSNAVYRCTELPEDCWYEHQYLSSHVSPYLACGSRMLCTLHADCRLVMQVTAQTKQPGLQDCSQPSGQQSLQGQPPVALLQQPTAAQPAEQGDGQAGAHAVADLTATTTSAQLQAPAVAKKPQKRKKPTQTIADGQPTASKAVAEDSKKGKKKKKKQQKQHSEDAVETVTKAAERSATLAAVEDMPQARALAAAQDAEMSAVGNTPAADTTKSGQLQSILHK